MNTPETLMPGSVKRLVHCINALGLVRGWKYWRLDNSLRECPGRAIAWAIACETEAASILNTEPQAAYWMFKWAQEIRAHHAAYSVNDKLSGGAKQP